MLIDNDRFMHVLTETAHHQHIVTSCVKMDAPDDLERLRQFVHDHFIKFRKCRSTLVRICPSNYFFREITDQSILNNMVELHTEAMDDDEVHAFQARNHPLWHEIENGRPLVKIWIVPSREPKVAYIVLKFYHQISDGTSMLQVLSLM